LRALESHEVHRVGDSKAIPVDIRVIAATNADLAREVEEKSFRLDLFYRLNVVPLRVPSLRERPEDVSLLTQHFLAAIAERTGRSPQAIDPGALELLRAQSWPGNVRQLKNVLEGASVFASGPSITRADVEEILGSGPALAPSPQRLAAGRDPYEAPTFEEFKELSEALFFEKKLGEHEGNIKRTAEALGMMRSHLYKKSTAIDYDGAVGERRPDGLVFDRRGRRGTSLLVRPRKTRG
jgi:DNA-binding NtrC family response regulator